MMMSSRASSWLKRSSKKSSHLLTRCELFQVHYASMHYNYMLHGIIIQTQHTASSVNSQLNKVTYIELESYCLLLVWLKHYSLHVAFFVDTCTCCSPVTSYFLWRTGCSTRRLILCPSCTWATSPCRAARANGREDRRGALSPSTAPLLNTSLLLKDSRGENWTPQPLSPPALWIMGLQWTQETPSCLSISLMYSLNDKLVDWSRDTYCTPISGQKKTRVSHQGRILSSLFFSFFSNLVTFHDLVDEWFSDQPFRFPRRQMWPPVKSFSGHTGMFRISSQRLILAVSG